jgi:hypothetical protein
MRLSGQGFRIVDERVSLEKEKAMQMGNHEIDSSTGDTAGADRVIDTAFAFWRSTLLLSADELGLFAALASGTTDAATIGKRLGIGTEEADDLLGALTQLGFVERQYDSYCSLPIAARFLDPASPEYVGNWLTMARATMRETIDLTERLHATGARDVRDVPMSAMWADIAAILETNHTP